MAGHGDIEDCAGRGRRRKAHRRELRRARQAVHLGEHQPARTDNTFIPLRRDSSSCYLIGESRLAVSILRRDETQLLRSTDCRFESRPLVPPAGLPQIEMYELTLAARGRHASEAHGPGTRELVVVLSGALRMLVGDRAEELTAGDSIVFNADVKHVYENPGSSEARYHDLIIYKR